MSLARMIMESVGFRSLVRQMVSFIHSLETLVTNRGDGGSSLGELAVVVVERGRGRGGGGEGERERERLTIFHKFIINSLYKFLPLRPSCAKSKTFMPSQSISIVCIFQPLIGIDEFLLQFVQFRLAKHDDTIMQPSIPPRQKKILVAIHPCCKPGEAIGMMLHGAIDAVFVDISRFPVRWDRAGDIRGEVI